MYNTYGKKLCEMREKRGLTQAEVARRADVSREAITRIEKGTLNLSLKMLEILADIFECSTDEILGRKVS